MTQLVAYIVFMLKEATLLFNRNFLCYKFLIQTRTLQQIVWRLDLTHVLYHEENVELTTNI